MNITEVIDREQAKEFFDAIEDAISSMNLTQMEEAYLFVKRRNAIAISFDKRVVI